MENKTKKIRKSEEDYQRESMHGEGYWIAEWQLKLFDELRKYQEKFNLNQTELGEKLGVSKGYISQILNGKFDHKISTLVHLALAIGKAPILSFQDLEMYIENELEGQNSLSEKDQSAYNDFKKTITLELSAGSFEQTIVSEM